MNPDDARPGGLMADAGLHAGMPGQGVAARVPGQSGPSEVAGQGGTAGVAEQGEAGERRDVSFRTSGLRIELEMTGGEGARRLAGRLIPAQAAVVEIRGIITVQADASGRFTAEEVPAGLLSLRCRLGTEADATRIATGWVTL